MKLMRDSYNDINSNSDNSLFMAFTINGFLQENSKYTNISYIMVVHVSILHIGGETE